MVLSMPKDTRILVVDDSPAILALLKDQLRARGFTNVLTAESVAEGLRIVDEEKPEVVFLDLMMPESSGLEFTRLALEKNPQMHIVVTTALPPNHESVVMAVSQGASEYLPKPVRKESLAQVLDHLGRDFAAHDQGWGDVSYG